MPNGLYGGVRGRGLNAPSYSIIEMINEMINKGAYSYTPVL